LQDGDSRGNTRILSNRSEPKHAELRKRAEELYSEVGGTLVKSEGKPKPSEIEELLKSGMKMNGQ